MNDFFQFCWSVMRGPQNKTRQDWNRKSWDLAHYKGKMTGQNAQRRNETSFMMRCGTAASKQSKPEPKPSLESNRSVQTSLSVDWLLLSWVGQGVRGTGLLECRTTMTVEVWFGPFYNGSNSILNSWGWMIRGQWSCQRSSLSEQLS